MSARARSANAAGSNEGPAREGGGAMEAHRKIVGGARARSAEPTAARSSGI